MLRLALKKTPSHCARVWEITVPKVTWRRRSSFELISALPKRRWSKVEWSWVCCEKLTCFNRTQICTLLYTEKKKLFETVWKRKVKDSIDGGLKMPSQDHRNPLNKPWTTQRAIHKSHKINPFWLNIKCQKSQLQIHNWLAVSSTK